MRLGKKVAIVTETSEAECQRLMDVNLKASYMNGSVRVVDGGWTAR